MSFHLDPARLHVSELLHWSIADRPMMKPPVRGTTSWQGYTLDYKVSVPVNSLVFGIHIYGTGEVWLKDIVLEVDSFAATKKVRRQNPLQFQLRERSEEEEEEE